MNFTDIHKLLDTWFSKKWILFLIVLALGVFGAHTDNLDSVYAAFLVSMATGYGVINIANKDRVLQGLKDKGGS